MSYKGDELVDAIRNQSAMKHDSSQMSQPTLGRHVQAPFYSYCQNKSISGSVQIYQHIICTKIKILLNTTKQVQLFSQRDQKATKHLLLKILSLKSVSNSI